MIKRDVWGKFSNFSFYKFFSFSKCPFLSFSFAKEKEMKFCILRMLRKKEKERPWAGERLQANMGIYRLFRWEKVSTSSKRDIQCDTHLCSHKRDSVTTARFHRY